MRVFLLTLVALFPIRAQDVMEIVYAYSAREASRFDRSRDYTYQLNVVHRRFKRDGTLKSSSSETYDVLIVNGKPVQKLIESNGRPATEQEARARQQALERAAAHARAVTGPNRGIADRYNDFQLEGEEEINGRRAWVVSASRKLAGGIIQSRAKLWIDEIDYECAKIELQSKANLITIDGWGHAAGSGDYEYARVAEGVWLPVHAMHRNDAYMPLTVFPISLLAQHQDHWELETTYTNYKRFQADSRIVGLGEPAEAK